MVVATLGCRGYQACELMLDKVVELLQKGIDAISLKCNHRVTICCSRRIEKRVTRETAKPEQHQTRYKPF